MTIEATETPCGFLALPAANDDTVRQLADRVRTIAFKKLVAFDRSALSTATGRALGTIQSNLYALATRDRAGRDRVAAIFDDVDIRTCALALDAGPAFAEEAAQTIARLLAAAMSVREPPARGPLHAVSPALPALHLVEVDLNPVRTIEAHPEKTGNAVNLGGRPVTEWTRALADAIALVVGALPDLAVELATTLRRIVPVGYDPDRHMSCSYREAPGLVYLTLHPNLVTMAEALVHETQHGKLNLLSWVDPILENPASELVASPVRPDPRPLMGVLLAAHAFVPVAWLHRRLADLGHPLASTPWFERRTQQVMADNAEALAVLAEHARPTPTGARVIAALVDLHRDSLPPQ